MASEGNRDRSIAEIVRDCVREELQCSSVQSISDKSSQARQSSPIISGAKKPSTYGHPWRFKKGKQKMPQQQDFTPKALHLLDMYMAADHDELSDEEPNAGPSTSYIPDYPIKDEYILLKGYFELGTAQTESEIRNSICEVIKQCYPFVESHHFDFVKRDRNKITTPVVTKALTWNCRHVKELCGQGKLYVRLNLPKECIQMIASTSVTSGASESEETKSDEELMKPALSSATPAKRLCSSSVTVIPDDKVESVSTTNTLSCTVPTKPSTHSKKQSDKDKLRELAPFASEKQLDDALTDNFSLAFAADSLLQDYNSAVDVEVEVDTSTIEDQEELQTLTQITFKLKKKLTGKKKRLEIDQDDLLNDAVAYFKSNEFDACCPLRISFRDQPAVDTGGVLRQFFTDLFDGLANGELIELFEGNISRMVPSYRPQAVMSGMLEMIGQMIASSLVQGGPGFPFLSLPCYYYLVTGDVMCSMAYCNYLDIPDSSSRNIVLKMMDAQTEDDMENLRKDDEVLSLLTQCGETSVLNMSTKVKIIQGVAMYEVISKRKVALDQMRNGLKTLGVLNEMSNHPDIFESVFTFKSVELTSTTVKECFKYPVELNEKENRVKEMVTKFINMSTTERLKQLMQYCTGGKSIPS